MRRLTITAVMAVCGLMLADLAFAESDAITLTVNAGKHDRTNTPVAVLIDAPSDATSAVLVDQSGAEIPAQLTSPGLRSNAAANKSELHFVLPSLKQGRSITLTARFSADSPSREFSWQEEPDEYAELSFADRPVMRYMCPKLTNETREDAFKVYHHLYDPSGTRFVTKGPGSRYTHHRGLFFGYCHVTHAGGKADTWSGRATPQTHGGYLAREAGPVLGRHCVQVNWCGTKGEVYVTEQRELSAYHVPGGTLVDFASKCATTGSKVKLDGNAPHAGFQFRAAAEVAERTEKQTYYLRPDGKGELGQARAKAFDLPWDAISFVLEGQRYTVVYLDRPDNPKPAEYNERSYGRFGSFFRYELEDGKDLRVAYRVWLQDGEMAIPEATSLSADFIEPPTVEVGGH